MDLIKYSILAYEIIKWLICLLQITKEWSEKLEKTLGQYKLILESKRKICFRMEIVTDRKIMVCMIYENWEFTITYSNIGVEHSYIHLFMLMCESLMTLDKKDFD